MSILVKAMVAAAAAAMGVVVASAAQAQPGYGGYGYGYGELPPAPYQEVGEGSAASCGRDSFTLLGAHAGVTVLGVDLGASAHLGVPTDVDCDRGYAAPAYAPRPYAPPEEPNGYGPPPPSPCGQPACGEVAYAPPPYAQPGYEPQYPPAYPDYRAQYAPQPGPQPMWGYGSPCGCAAPSW